LRPSRSREAGQKTSRRVVRIPEKYSERMTLGVTVILFGFAASPVTDHMNRGLNE